MAAIDTLTATQLASLKVFAYSLRASPTADLLADCAGYLGGGGTPTQLVDVLHEKAQIDARFAGYAVGHPAVQFAETLVNNLSFGLTISSAARESWVTAVVSLDPLFASRGELVSALGAVIEGYQGSDADLLALQAGLKDRVEKAAAYVQSAAGATWGGSVEQLLAPVRPAPTYTLALGSEGPFDEGQVVAVSLQTTGVEPGTVVGFELTGTGITTADFESVEGRGVDTLTGVFRPLLGFGGTKVVFELAADMLTEGPETLRLVLADGRGEISMRVNDTSTSPPPPPPVYALSADRNTVDEGGSVTYTLATKNVAAGTEIPFVLSGTGIIGADIVGGALAGSFKLGADGSAQAVVAIAADASTEGAETLRLQLSGNLGSFDLTINDTSLTPAPVGRPDTVIVADTMASAQATTPPTPAEGEIGIDSWLSADLLDQSGGAARRLTIAELRASSTIAGAPLVTTNQSADRGNIPQVSNQQLFTFDLGLDVDRVDYSAEKGRVAAIVGKDASAATQYVLVNDDASDRVYNDKTDRIDTLIDVEQIVASAGGGLIDLTASARDWLVSFSRNFNPATDVDAKLDRATHRVELSDLVSGTPLGRSYLDVRDAGGSASITQATAAWVAIEGSDRNETLVFTDAESLDARSNELRGGTNTVKFNELTRSILVDVAWTPWLPSSSLADDRNASGIVAASVRFTVGDGLTLLGPNVNLVRSHTADNAVAAGLLKLVGSQDAEDAVGFEGTKLPLQVTLGVVGAGDLVKVRPLIGPATDALELTGFEIVRDHGGVDDLFDVQDLARTVSAGPRLLDSGVGDHDALSLADNAVAGIVAAGGVAGAINLATVNSASSGLNFDFDVLDVTNLSGNALVLAGTAAFDDELVVGRLGALKSVGGFEALVLTEASIDQGKGFVLDLDAAAVRTIGGLKLFDYDGSAVSAGGLAFGTPGQTSYVPPLTSGMLITVTDTSAGAGATVWGGNGADTITGGYGNDVIRGGGGNDVLGGGAFAETWRFTLFGTPDAVAAAANRITLTLTVDGTVLTLTEAAVADTAYGDGNGAVVDGASRTLIGNALANLVNVNLAAINAGPGSGKLVAASFNATSGDLLFSFTPGLNANDLVSLVLNSGAGPDGGGFAVSAAVNVDGGSGSDTFVFEASGALNGGDTISNFGAGVDRLDVTAFIGTAISVASTAVDGALGGIFSGPASTAQFVFNKTGGQLTASDFAASATAGKLVVADGSRYVVTVTADPTGALGDPTNTPMSLYYVENGAAPGLGDLTVTLVATVGAVSELTLADMFTALS